MHIAFLTNEYPTENSSDGGLATYLQRMAHLLRDAGHEVEVFLVSNTRDANRVEGILIQRVDGDAKRGVADRALGLLTRIVRRPRRLAAAIGSATAWMRSARALAEALEERHLEVPFDLVQSADFKATGLYVRRTTGRVHAVRCSSAADLYGSADGDRSWATRVRGRLERRLMRRADIVYSPSQFMADHFNRKHAIAVEVLRPPAASPKRVVPQDTQLPPRFFVHFGQISERKGSVFLGETLPLVWAQVPEFRMVWCGVCWDSELIARLKASWGAHAEKVAYLGAVDRGELPWILTQAEAAVLPSMVDNLPNTVIECLSAGVPVIGTDGASIDEIVEHGRTGRLVPFNDRNALSEALIGQWTRPSEVKKGFCWEGPLKDEMASDAAVDAFLSLTRRKRPQND